MMCQMQSYHTKEIFCQQVLLHLMKHMPIRAMNPQARENRKAKMRFLRTITPNSGLLECQVNHKLQMCLCCVMYIVLGERPGNKKACLFETPLLLAVSQLPHCKATYLSRFKHSSARDRLINLILSSLSFAGFKSQVCSMRLLYSFFCWSKDGQKVSI